MLRIRPGSGRGPACETQRGGASSHRAAVLMATWALVMAEVQSSSSLLTLSILSLWAFSLWLLMSTIRVWSRFTSASTFPALLDAASKSGRETPGGQSTSGSTAVSYRGGQR